MTADEAASQRGQKIYERGVGTSDQPITARLGGQSFELPASALPCVGCHGPDGAGIAEGGVRPSDIRWDTLSRPQDQRSPTGPAGRPAYDPRTLIRAVTLGVDPAGRELDMAMPRYGLSRSDAEDLVVFLRRLGSYDEPGVDPQTLRLGTVIPPAGPYRPVGQMVERVLRSELDRWNQAGGLFGRRIELNIFPSLDDASQADVFLWLMPVLEGIDGVVLDQLEDLERPILSPWSPSLPTQSQSAPASARPKPSFGMSNVFYFLPDFETQARVLIRTAARQHPSHRPAVLADALPKHLTEEPIDPISSIEQLTGLSPGAPLVVLLQNRDQLAAVADLARSPTAGRHIYAPVTLVGDALSLTSRVHLAFPAVPSDISPDMTRRQTHYLGRAPPLEAPASILRLALAVSDLTLDLLRRLGTQPDGRGFLHELQGLYRYSTGATPPITFGPNRRIGSNGVWLVSGDEHGGVGKVRWIEDLHPGSPLTGERAPGRDTAPPP